MHLSSRVWYPEQEDLVLIANNAVKAVARAGGEDGEAQWSGAFTGLAEDPGSIPSITPSHWPLCPFV